MIYSGYDLALLFLIYSFLGWVIETVVATVKKRNFINRGFFSGPFCHIYGFSALVMTVVLRDLKSQPFFLFAGCMILATVIEWITGKLLERINHQRWWDYSDKKWNFDGYICLQYSLLWGILGTAAMMVFNDVFLGLSGLLPEVLERIIVIVFAVIVVLDCITSLIAMFWVRKETPLVRRWNRFMWLWTIRLGNFITSRVEHRVEKAYSVTAQKDRPSRSKAEKKAMPFAAGCSMFKLFWLFLIGAFLGDIVETIFCRITAGVWMSRSSLVWGPFSIVWGLALALATALLYKDRNKPDGHLFIIGTVLGGAYEYICSVATEIMFGKVFWDYSHMPFNLGGRVNLLYCFFWGIAAVVWIKLVYPKMSAMIEKIPKKPGTVLTWLLILFMAANMLVSVMALVRYDSRGKGVEASDRWEQIMDERFNDERMELIYPNAKQR